MKWIGYFWCLMIFFVCGILIGIVSQHHQKKPLLLGPCKLFSHHSNRDVAWVYGDKSLFGSFNVYVCQGQAVYINDEDARRYEMH